jgi:5-(carboxyamino)imidazole ribonucleotide mutase
MPEVGIILGSDSDLPKVKDCFKILEEFEVDFEILISSAHRTPVQTKKWVSSARDRGIKVIIAVAGGAAHLPGVVAAYTTLPVLGVPIVSGISGGMDSILSILQMPSGIPVGTMPVGSASGANSALFAINILSVIDKKYEEKLKKFRADMITKISGKNEAMNKMGYKEYIKVLEDKK